MQQISFAVYGKAETKGSARAIKLNNGRVNVTNDNPKTKAWQGIVATVAQENRPENGILQGAVVVGVDFYFLRPKSVSAKKRHNMTVKPDIDKITRSVLDGLKGVIYADDAQVISLQVRKRYGDPPRAEITIIDLSEN